VLSDDKLKKLAQAYFTLGAIAAILSTDIHA